MKQALVCSLIAASVCNSTHAQTPASLVLNNGQFQLQLPYIQNNLNSQVYSARFNSATLPVFQLDASSVQVVAAVSQPVQPSSLSSSGNGWRLSIPSLEYVSGDKTQSFNVSLLSPSGFGAFTADQITSGPAWGQGGGSCRPVSYESSATVLSGQLQLEFENIAQKEGMLHVRLTNLSSNTLFLSLDVSSEDGRVGLMAPQANILYLAPAESSMAYVLYYSTGDSGPTSYRTVFKFTQMDASTGKSTTTTDTLQKTISFVRNAETPVTVTDASPQLTYTRTAQVAASVGFWRYKVDASESKIVLFPGQENWTQASAAAQAQVMAYTLDGQKLWTYAPGAEVWGGDMSADGKYVAFATVGSQSNGSSRLILLDAQTGQLQKEITLKVGELPTPSGAIPPITAETDAREVRFSADGNQIAVGTSEGRAYLFNRADLSALYSWQTKGQLRAISFAGEHLYLGAGDGLLYKIQTANGSVVWRSYTTAWPYSEPALSPDGKHIIVGAKSGGFTVLNSDTGACVFSANYGTVRRAFFTPDASQIIAATGATQAGTIAYRTSDWSIAWRGPMSAAASVTADSKYAFMADGKAWIMDTSTGKRVASLDPGFTTNANYFKTAYISKDGSRAIVARRDLTQGDTAIAFFKKQ